MSDPKTRTRSKATIIFTVISLLFLLPILSAWMLYLKKESLGKALNYGELINPPIKLSDLLVSGVSTTSGKWLILLYNPGPCEQDCQENLYQIQQIWKATGGDRLRVRRAILTYQNLKNREYLGTEHFTANKMVFNKVILDHVKQPHALQNGTIYLIDPNDNIMMFYKAGTPATALFKDLKRLLKVSQIG